MTDKECNAILRERIRELDHDIAAERKLAVEFQNPYYIEFLLKAQAQYQEEINAPIES